MSSDPSRPEEASSASQSMTAAPTWFRSLLDKISERLPQELRKTPIIRQRALVAIGLLHSLVATLVATLVFLWVSQVPGKYFLSGVTLTLMGMMWWPHQLLMREYAISRAGNILSGILTLGTALIIAASGGAKSPAILELLFGPIVAVVLSGPMVGFRWGVVTFCIYLGFAFGPGLGVPLPVYIVLPDSDWMFLVSISTVLFFVIWSAYLSDQARQTAIRGEQQAMTDLNSVREQERQAQLVAVRITAESEAKSAFLAHMSHELRTPLNIILGYIELIRERVEDADYEGLEKDVGHASGAAGHLLELINDVLDLSRLDTTTPPTLESVDIPAFTSSVIQSFKLVAHQANIQLHLHLDQAPLELVTSERHLRQILVNLINNALKFTDQGSVTLQVVAAENWIRFDVRDTGIGIPQDKQEAIFQPFSQVDRSSTRRYEGTGLGLAICKGLAHNLGGHLRVTSTYGTGSTFTLELPYVKAPDSSVLPGATHQDNRESPGD